MHLKLTKYYSFLVFVLISFTFNAYSSKSRFRGDVFVDVSAKKVLYEKVAVLPFKAPIELAGSSVSDFFTTELLLNYKYQMIERGQIENIFKEQALNLSGVTDNSIAVKVGAILGVQGSIIGTISEYGYQQKKSKKLPSVGLSIRMIDTTSGKIVWSVSDSQLGSYKTSLSQHAKMMVKNMVTALLRKCREVGDIMATALPKPEIISISGGVRSTTIEWARDGTSLIKGYQILRSTLSEGPYQVAGKKQNNGPQIIRFIDSKLLDSSMYYYKIQGISKTGLLTMPSKNMEIITAGPPPQPYNIIATSGDLRKVTVSWESINDPNIEGYFIFRKTEESFFKEITYVAGTAKSSYTDSGTKKERLGDDQLYEYAVCSVNTAKVRSKRSKSASAKTCPLPSAVTNVFAENNMVKSVALRWDKAAENNLKGYCIYRSKHFDRGFEIIAFTKGTNNNTYLDKSKGKKALKDGRTYHYRIASYYQKDAIGELSKTATAITKPLPERVKKLQAISGEIKQISLNWEENPESDISHYLIYRKKPKQKKFKTYTQVESKNTSYVDEDLKDGACYLYAISAIDEDNLTSLPTDLVRASTKPVPVKPEGLNAYLEDTYVNLTWDINPEDDIATYKVFRKKSFKKILIDETNSTSIIIGDLLPNKAYAFVINAVDKDGLQSAFSKAVKIKTPKQ